MAKLSVSGKIIEEISHGIPGTKFAIIELIKNAYEARANEITIDVSPEQIILKDDGKGMNNKEIETLLTVSDSNKVFGQEIDGRLISGEKGLGFFSAFKFGNKIKVSTYKDGIQSCFKLDMKKISNQKSLYHLDIPIDEIPYDNPNLKGTEIYISDLHDEIFNLFKDRLDDEAEYLKLRHVIEDPDFKIIINKSWGNNFKKTISTSKLEEVKWAVANFNSNKMYDIVRGSKEYFIKLIRNNNEHKIMIDKKYNQLFDNDEFLLKINIDIYNLKGLDKNIVPKLYHDIKEKRIIPLIYINNSLFDNYTMYNPNINAAKNNSYVFRQQAGKIELILRSPGIISFNADRTQMTESTNSKLFQSFLDFFSSQIQIKLREVLNAEENSRPKTYQRQSFVNTIPDLSYNNHIVTSIKQDGVEKSNVLTNEVGKWEITYSNGDKIILIVEDRPDPVIKQVNQEFIVGRQYSFDELFTFRDCENGTKIAPLEFTILPEDCRSLDNVNRKVTFNKPCFINFKLKIKDKISGKELNAEYIADSIFPKSNHSRNTNEVKPVIHPLMEIEQNVKQDIIKFKNELNDLYKSGKYEMVFISALRTFVELIVNDIVEKLGKPLNEKLHINYNLINRDENIKDAFINMIPSSREKAGIKAIYEQLKNEGRYNSTVKYLNLTTHAAQRIITMKQVESDFPAINLIYTYLCFVSK